MASRGCLSGSMQLMLGRVCFFSLEGAHRDAFTLA
jgi:hypothetical protein